MQTTVAGILDEKGRQVWSIAPDATVYEALELMAEHNVGAVVVVEEGRLVGIMSERDYARKVVLLDRFSRGTRVRDIMTPDVLTVTPEETVAGCMALMTEHRVRHLPVVVEGRLVGLVSIGDVVRAVITDQRFLIEQLERYITS